MKSQTFNFKGQFLFLLGLTIPAALIGSINSAQAEPSSPTIKQNAPFIDSSSRYDSLKGLQTKPIGGINQADGGTKGKDASDKGKDASDKGKDKDVCEGGSCGNSPIGKQRELLIQPAFEKIQRQGGQFRSQLPSQLFSSQQPII
jgi:hypothetical protein